MTTRNQLITLPHRMFAVGEEPVGVRVTPYHKPCGIRRILKGLEDEEVEFIRGSQFGKFVEIADLPSFSGRFGRYVISRQLKVKKKREAWFLFAGKPIRFSIREFAEVTGLNCGKYPANSKKRSTRNINEKPYWGELFGTLKDVPVASVVRMLEKRTVTERDTRIKYACLALLASVILPTTHSHRISHDHTEMIKDINEFLAYPWGRVAFELLISSIKERNEIALSQNTIALKGFVLSLQLVMIEAVPALTEVVRDGSSSGSECGSGDDEEDDEGVQRGISPAHARDIDTGAKAQVVSILGSANLSNGSESDPDWSDKDEDVEVENMMGLIKMGHEFTNALFVGGVSSVDVTRMREEASVEAVVRKTKKKKKSPVTIPENVEPDYIVSLVRASMKEDVSCLQGQVGRLNESVSGFQSSLLTSVKNMFENLKTEIATATSEAIRKALEIAPSTGTLNGSRNQPDNVHSSVVPDGPLVADDLHQNIINSAINFGIEASELIEHEVDCNVPEPIRPQVDGVGTVGQNQETDDTNTGDGETGPHVEDPTFSLGLSQEEAGGDAVMKENEVVPCSEKNPAEKEGEDDFDVPLHAFRKSKRARVVPKALVGEYACDVRLLNQARVAHFGVNSAGGNIDYSAKYAKLVEKLDSGISEIKLGDSFIGSKEITQIVEMKTQLPAKIVDVLMCQTRLLYQSQATTGAAIFLDTRFVSQLGKCSAKFSKTANKESFTFPTSLCGPVRRESVGAGALRYYFPFNLDKTHWVGICADTSTSTLLVLDCNFALRSDALMMKELKNIAIMFPYLLRQAGKAGSVRDTKPLHVERPRSVPQNADRMQSAVSTVLLIQAHAVAGVEVCKCITPDVLPKEVERLAVMMYEENVGSL